MDQEEHQEMYTDVNDMRFLTWSETPEDLHLQDRFPSLSDPLDNSGGAMDIYKCLSLLLFTLPPQGKWFPFQSVKIL